jgi:hypothetical protein
MVYFRVANIFFDQIFRANNTYQPQILVEGVNLKNNNNKGSEYPTSANPRWCRGGHTLTEGDEINFFEEIRWGGYKDSYFGAEHFLSISSFKLCSEGKWHFYSHVKFWENDLCPN